MLRRFLDWFSEKFQRRTIPGEDGSPYLTRFKLLQTQSFKKNFTVYLHHFHRGDQDSELHNHPWRWGVSLILLGGYSEERRGNGSKVYRREFRPGSINFIGANTYHRADLLGKDCWTLFVVGDIVQSWGFWSRVTEEFIPWRAFVARNNPSIQ